MSETLGGVSTPIILLGFLAIFWTVLFLLKQFAHDKLERLGLDVNVPLLMWRTKRFNNLIDAIARRARDPWKVIGTIGFAVSLGLIPLAVRVMLGGWLPYVVTQLALYGPEPLRGIVTYLFGSQINQPTQCVTLLLPGVTVSLASFLDWTLIGALLVVIVVHEGAHGILARAEGIIVKNSGLLLLLVIPGAFVEPEEEQLKKAKRISQLRVLSAGTSANFTVGLVFLLLIANFGVYYATISPFYQPSNGVLVTYVVPNSAAANASIQVGQVITKVSNATAVYQIHDESDFNATLYRLVPGEKVTLHLLNSSTGESQSVPMILGVYPNTNGCVQHANGFIGVSTFNYYPAKFPSILNSFAASALYRLDSNIFLFSVGIAAVNMLPIWGLDGDRVVKLLLEKFFGTHKKAAANTLTAARIFSIAIIALAAITTYALHGPISI